MTNIKETLLELFNEVSEQGFRPLIYRLFPSVILLAMVMTISSLTQNLNAYLYVEKQTNTAIETVLSEYNEDVLVSTKGVTFETIDGLVHSYRVHGTEQSYSMYFNDGQYDEPLVYNETAAEWLTDASVVPPIITQAFISENIGLPESFEDNTVVVDGAEYAVGGTHYYVEIDEDTLYAPLPTLPDRVQGFVDDYITFEENQTKVVKVVRNQTKELIYFEHGDDVYELTHGFDGSAKIGHVEDGFELIYDEE